MLQGDSLQPLFTKYRPFFFHTPPNAKGFVIPRRRGWSSVHAYMYVCLHVPLFVCSPVRIYFFLSARPNAMELYTYIHYENQEVHVSFLLLNALSQKKGASYNKPLSTGGFISPKWFVNFFRFIDFYHSIMEKSVTFTEGCCGIALGSRGLPC